jgi:Tfp pilus assembly protein PilP
MPQVKAEITPTPPNPMALKPKSVISRISKARVTKANPSLSTRVDKHMLANTTGSFQDDVPPYNSTGKIDPFVPLIRETVIKKPNFPKFPLTDNPNKGPLEKMDLSQLKLTAIIIPDRGGNRGLVEESSGKGHIVVLNTRIGTYGGKVVEIQKDRLIIEEKGRDEFGRIVTRKKELILPSLIAGK